MKLLSITVPCYNSEAYMRKCIDSLLIGGDNVEILIVNDGSKDGTAQIADEYAEKYPSIVRVIHQENKGHGGAVNTGLAAATGIFFKVVDSDDYLNPKVFPDVLKRLEDLVMSATHIDMMVCNFVYDKDGARRKKVMSYRNSFPADRVFTWSETKNIGIAHYILMHSVIYRTAVLRECGLVLPEHTFYVDNLFVYLPLTCVRKMYYMDVNLYMYYIGREDQSVNEKVMISRVDQQIRVNKLMIDSCNLQKIREKKLREYMIRDLGLIMAVSSLLLIRAGTPEALQKKKDLWKYLKDKDLWLWRRVRSSLAGMSMNLPGWSGRKVSVIIYAIARQIYGFN